MGVGVLFLSTLLLVACNNKNAVKQSSSSDDRQSAKVASLKKENASLKKTHAKKAKTSGQSEEGNSSSSIAKSTSISSSESSNTDSADHAKAETLRNEIVSSSDGAYSASELEQVPDTAILAAEKQSATAGGDVGYIGQLIAKQYPNISSGQSNSSSEGGSLLSQLVNEDDLNWGGAAQRASFDSAAQEYINRGQKIAGFKQVNGTKYDVYFVGTDFPSMSVDIATGDVGD